MKDGTEDKPRVPLKTILQNFLNHVDSLESRKRGPDDPYEQEFQSLKAFSDSIKQQSEFSSKEGEKDVNRKKNRYKDILPFDYTRVSLSDYPGVPGSDYINANYIKGASGSNAYIASQGPLPNTVNDFWRMVVECEVQVIVMACNEQEAGKYKCENYWNDDENDEKQFGKFFVKLLKSREICPDFLVRTMRLRWTPDGGKAEEERTVCQFHYSAWPDHGVPNQVKPLLEMVRLIRDCQASETLPVLVHCSAGCGRTGTICAIDFIWGLLRTGKLTADFSLYELVRDMRKQRIAMVQTVEQYVLVHRAVRELFQEQLRVIDSHPYENVDGDGRPLCQGDNDINGGAAGDDIVPDYETIFVKRSDEDEEERQHHRMINAGDIDVILSQRMLQRNKMTDASSSTSSSSPPPQPPPKQRTPVETGAIETRTVTMSDEDGPSSERPTTGNGDTPMFLYDPPASSGGPSGNDFVSTQKIRKGDLKLTQMENGSWRLEDSEKVTNASSESSLPTPTGTISSIKSLGKKKSKSKDHISTHEDSGEQQLLRRPSIKKIRALFQKDSSKSNSTPASTETEENKEVLAAISKLPKFEPPAPFALSIGRSESASMPNSLDRRQLSKTSSTVAPSTELVSTKVLSSSENKPSLPVKRSKSMKVISKPVSFLFSSSSSSSTPPANNNSKFTKSLSVNENASELSFNDSLPKSGSFGGGSNATRFDFPSVPAVSSTSSSPNETSLPRSNSTGSQLSSHMADVSGPAKPARTNDYANVYVSADHSSAVDAIRSRISNYVNNSNNSNVSGIGGSGSKNQDASAGNSSMNEDAKRMLRDCQDYLVSSFEVAEREGEKLIKTCTSGLSSSGTSKNRSAESSPMTTLHKTPSGRQLFSSAHNSPSNSYNKYNNIVVSGGKVQLAQKTSPTSVHSIHKTSFTQSSQPGSDRQIVSARRASDDDISSSVPHSYENISVSVANGQTSAENANVTLEAQRKISAASQTQKTRERRNSFREAVQSGASRKQSYEPIWFAGDDEENSSSSSNVIYANASMASSQPGPDRPEESDHGEMADYESIMVNSEGRMVPVALSAKKKVSRESEPLHSVALVNEVVEYQTAAASREDGGSRGSNSPPGGLPHKVGLRKQYSNSSIHSSGSVKGPPPPYKQPPPPPSSTTTSVASFNIGYSDFNNASNTYANVPQMRQKQQQTKMLPLGGATSKDDSVLSRPIHRQTTKTRSASQVVNNRFSCGEWLLAPNAPQGPPYYNGSGDFFSHIGKSSASTSHHGTGSTGLSLPAIDLDAVAAMMQGGAGSSRASTNSPNSSAGGSGHQTSGSRNIGRSLAGVLSGAAANLRSRFSILGQHQQQQQQQQQQSNTVNSEIDVTSLPATLPSMFSTAGHNAIHQPPPSSSSYMGEQLPCNLPLTVPGATDSGYSTTYQSFPSSFPQRLDVRPLGPRDPPTHFQRKQEYL